MTEYEKGYKQGRKDESEVILDVVKAIHDQVYKMGFKDGYVAAKNNICEDDGK